MDIIRSDHYSYKFSAKTLYGIARCNSTIVRQCKTVSTPTQNFELLKSGKNPVKRFPLTYAEAFDHFTSWCLLVTFFCVSDQRDTDDSHPFYTNLSSDPLDDDNEVSKKPETILALIVLLLVPIVSQDDEDSSFTPSVFR